MKRFFLMSALLVVAVESDAQGGNQKKRAKVSSAGLGTDAATPSLRKQTEFTQTDQGLRKTGGHEISGGGESVLGAGIAKGAADKPGGGRGGSSVGTGGGGGPAAAQPEAPSKAFEKAKVGVSVSANGPFAQNGEVCNTGPVYSRTTGLDRTKPPKGCASAFDSKDCLDTANHREFLPNEWLDPFTIQTVVNGPDYPAGKYAMYLSDSKNAVKQVGFATLKTCAPPAPVAPPPAACRWEAQEAVFGPCPPDTRGPCSANGQTSTFCGGRSLCVCN